MHPAILPAQATCDTGEAPKMQFDEGVEALSDYTAVSVRYKDRMWEIDLNSAKTGGREASSIAFDLQAALNLARPPVGLQLHVAPGAEAVVCPLSVLVACPSYIASTFQGEHKFIPQTRGKKIDEARGYLLCCIPLPARTGNL